MMRNSSSRTGLFLMELIIAILFFSLAAAICIQLFVQSHMISNRSVDLNHGILWAQNVAETFYGCNGNINQMAALLDNCILDSENKAQGSLTVVFDENFNPVSYGDLSTEKDTPDYSYQLIADISKEADLIVCNIIVENTKDAESVYSLNVSLFPDKEVSDEQ